MNLKDASLFAIAGMLLIVIVTFADLLKDVMGVLRDILPAVTLLRGSIYFIASVFILLFFYVFRRTQ